MGKGKTNSTATVDFHGRNPEGSEGDGETGIGEFLAQFYRMSLPYHTVEEQSNIVIFEQYKWGKRFRVSVIDCHCSIFE